MKLKQVAIPLLLLSGVLFHSWNFTSQEKKRRDLKHDLIELSKVKYGIFSVDEWKKILATIISKKVEELEIAGANRQQMEKKISGFLYSAISDYEDRTYKENSGKFFGFIKSGIDSYFIERLKKEIPNFTRQIMGFIEDPANRKAVRSYIIAKLNDYADKTFSKIDYSVHNAILAKHGLKEREEAITSIESRVASVEASMVFHKFGILIFSFLASLYLIFGSQITKAAYAILTALCFALLFSGLFLPMIEIDARISEMNFTLLGEPVSFKDQVLYYKSKSILEVVSMMLEQSRMDLLFVGILVFLFSVLFPVSKLFTSLLYIYVPGLKQNRFVSFMIFKTGKWSMADVMVIAIFMSYIGFSGIISEQLRQIETITQTLEVLTTNKSSLLNGFYCFTSFALLSLLLSHKLQYSQKVVQPAQN